MAEILYGKPVAEAVKEDIKKRNFKLKESGIVPKLAILRSGERPDDIAYEKRVQKLCENLDIAYEKIVVDREISQEKFIEQVKKLNDADDIHGYLIFRPLPFQINEEELELYIDVNKDLDRIHPDNFKSLFAEMSEEYSPATPEAVIEMLKFYGYDLDGANVVIINRSLVLGRPLSMLFLGQNSTVTICHSHTKDLPSIARKADILVTGIGRPEYFEKEYFSENQVIIDVGINFKNGKMTGDVDFETASNIVKAISPVPGGVGTITSTLLLRHLIEAAEKHNSPKK